MLAKTDAAGNVVSSADYRSYGPQTLGMPEDGPGYTGHVNDTESGLVYMQARYYDPDIAAFISNDPKAAEAGRLETFSRYGYASANPIRYTDPNGKQSWCTPRNCGAQSYLAASQEASYIKDNFDAVVEVKGAYGAGRDR